MRPWVTLVEMVLLVAAPAGGATASPESAWRSRAEEATARLQELDRQMKALQKSGAKKTSEEFRRLELTAILERAFADHLDSKQAKDLRRVLPGGDEVFTLALHTGKRKISFVVSYLYDGAGRPLGVRVLALPESWSVLLPGRGPEGDRRMFVDPGVPGKGAPPVLVFDLEDAARSSVTTRP
ncbi:MAG TPA: hypothetical protein VMK42_10905 [Anaeromyxobacteraceae bacterium]|nr:hypothetical protein [Anaeromyxobacteraceae bacterium]